MLNKVVIHNFQSHADTELDLLAGVNSISGGSDEGKSAILRAIFWVVTNRPEGNSIISDWIRTPKGDIKAGEATEVILYTDKGTIHRLKSKDFNGYILKPTGEKDLKLEALKGEVPPQVAAMLGVDAINIQRQMDPPFLLAMSSGAAAREINTLVRLSDIDLSQKEIKSQGRKNADLLDTTTQELLSIDSVLEKLVDLPEAHIVLSSLESCTAEKETRIALVDTIQQSSRRYTLGLVVVSIIEPLVSDSLGVVAAIERDYSRQARLFPRQSQLSKSMPLYRDACRIGVISSDIGLGEIYLQEMQAGVNSYLILAPKRDSLGQTLNSYLQAAQLSAGLADIPDANQIFSDITTLTAKIPGLAAMQRSLSTSQDAYVAASKSKASIVDTIEQADVILGRLFRLLGLRTETEVLFNQVSPTITSYRSAQREATLAGAEIIELEKQLPDICPLCGNILKK